MSEISAYELFCVYPECGAAISSGCMLKQTLRNCYFCKEHGDSFMNRSGKQITPLKCYLCNQPVKFLVGDIYFCENHYNDFKESVTNDSL
jgi:hypothetical protein